MGEVWLAEDTRLHRSVALKMLARGAGDAEAEARLLREARVASVLTHPNVAVVYEIGEAELDGRATHYIAMEHVRGRTLAELLREGKMSAAALLPIARQVAEALADAHEHGIVHRDVKPGNVMVGERGAVKVLDFGLARFAPPVTDESATWSGEHGGVDSALAGTLAYMSPEQLRGAPLDARCDVFSLGVLIHELVSGERPFLGDNAVALIDAILHQPAPPLPAEGVLEAGLARLVARMLEKDPEKRPAGMREVCRELEAVAAGLPARSPAAQQVVAVTRFGNLTGRPEDAWLGTGLAETLAAGLA
ncbi:MAG TPA: serine/threonine-protein kinase, partial [Vicinamibacteria bacterium]|nr:serine/threonine-protein kinase [Vicinamibacteria bacterium]